MKHAQQILLAMNRFLRSQGAKTIEPDKAFFAFDKDVCYENELSVSAAKIFSIENFEELLSPHFAQGHSWIHANEIANDT